jgi:hypothetical protein
MANLLLDNNERGVLLIWLDQRLTPRLLDAVAETT